MSDQLALSARLIPAETTRTIRGAILRPGLPLSESVYDGDDAPDSFHMGLFLGEELAGISSFYSQPMPAAYAQLVREHDATLLEGHHWRLRGMAIDTPYQRRGYGKTLLLAGIAHIAGLGGGWLWFNARSCAYNFYQSLGCQAWGEEFDIPGVGPHFVMTLRIPASA
jgi:ribosomal protein S18 acetylase RimI-like enzyme